MLQNMGLIGQYILQNMGLIGQYMLQNMGLIGQYILQNMDLIGQYEYYINKLCIKHNDKAWLCENRTVDNLTNQTMNYSSSSIQRDGKIGKIRQILVQAHIYCGVCVHSRI